METKRATYCAEVGRRTARPGLCPIHVRCPHPGICQIPKPPPPPPPAPVVRKRTRRKAAPVETPKEGLVPEEDGLAPVVSPGAE